MGDGPQTSESTSSRREEEDETETKKGNFKELHGRALD
jgi:hypothetical protein